MDPGPDVAGALGYGEVGSYRALPAGSYAVSVRPAGAPPDTPPALSAVVDVPAGGARTLALSGTFAELALTPLPDDLTAPAGGTARVRVLAAAATAPTVDVLVDPGPALATGLAFAGASGYTAVPAGPATVRLTSGGTGTAVPVDLAPGTVVSLLVLDAPGGGPTARVLVDAVAPAVLPVGGVEAGGSSERLPRFPRLAALLAASAQRAAVRDDLPVRVRVPAAGVDAAVTGSGLELTGALTVPADPAVAGWYAAGPAPGRPGPAVLAGHVDWAGRPAVFGGLGRLAPGDEIVVDRADGSSVRFAVDRVVRAPKDAFPTDAVYGPVPGAELRLITCGGVFDPAAGSYRDNLVVFARLVG